LLAAAEVPGNAVSGVMTAARLPERSPIGIREATDADLAFVLSLLNPQIEDSAYVYAEHPLTLDERRRWLSVHQAAGLPVLIGHDTVGASIGWGSLSPYRASSGYRFTVEASVYVDPRSQRQGVATALLRELERRARDLEKHAIVASIDSENAPSIALFERCGYREVARLPEVGRKFGAWRTQGLWLKLLTMPD
jgi:phosphinothricin acetyltransferase